MTLAPDPTYRSEVVLTQGEIRLLQLLRSLTFGEVTITKNDGVIVNVKETKTYRAEKFR